MARLKSVVKGRLVIRSDGTPQSTEIWLDGNMLTNVVGIEFTATTDHILCSFTRPIMGKKYEAVETRKVVF